MFEPLSMAETDKEARRSLVVITCAKAGGLHDSMRPARDEKK
jgi:hypothetical protein